MAIIKKRGGGATATQGTALSLTRADPTLAAAVTKAERSIYGAAYDQAGKRAPMLQEIHAFHAALSNRAQRNSDSLAIMRMLPDTELAAQILVSSILSPKDMMQVELIYATNTDDYQSDLSATLLARLRKHFEEDYPIAKELVAMVREPLFEKGSYPIAVIPENAIDEVINGRRTASMESLANFYYPTGATKPIGVLGVGTDKVVVGKFGVSMESFSDRPKTLQESDYQLQYPDKEIMTRSAEPLVFITDNPSALKTSKLLSYLQGKRVNNTYAAAMESTGYQSPAKVSDRMVEQAIFRHRPAQQAQSVEVPTQDQTQRKSVGNPLVMKLPSESVIPVHVPGDPSRHIGYYIVLDENGHPVYSPDSDTMQPGLSSNAQTGSVQSNIIQRAANNLGMADPSRFDSSNYMHMQAAVRVYGDMVERDLINRIRNGVLGATAALAKNEDIYRLMLARVLARKHTQILYLPLEYMTYIAFKYGNDGIGRSMLDDQSMLNMLRATMLFSEVLGSVKNSIGRTSVTGTIPQDDPDPMRAVETITHEIVKSRRLDLPLGVSNPADIMSFIQQAGFDFNWSGHPGMPDLKLEFAQTNSNYVKPDSDLMDKLRKSSIMGLGLSPETVDSGFNTEFATTALANNVLLSKRVIMWQDIFTPQLTNHMRQHARFTEKLVNDLHDILTENSDKILLEVEPVKGVEMSEELAKKLVIDHALRKFLETFQVTLPQPSSVTLESQMNELKSYSDALDVALESYITTDLFTTNTVGDLSDQATTLRALIKAFFMRKWMTEKGLFTELASLLGADNEGNPQASIVDEIKGHLESLTKAGVMTLVKLSPNRDAATADMKKIGAVEDTGGGDSGGGGGDSFGDSGGGDDAFDDMGMGGDNGGGADDMPDDGADATDEEATADEPSAADSDKPDDAKSDEPADVPEEDAAADDKGDDTVEGGDK